jgi:hypothetical protein
VPLQQNPIVVEIVKQPEPTPDMSVDAAIGIFALAGLFLVAAVLGCLLVAGGILLYRRWRDATGASPAPTHSHTRLHI